MLGPVLFFALLEGGLRLLGYGDPTSFFIERKAPDGTLVETENPAFGRRFFPPGLAREPLMFSIPVTKPAKTFRIFVLGESAALGVPDSSTSFARVLEVMLRERFPQVKFEVVNTAVVAINSHAIVPIARECARLQPDLFIVLMGNNEVIGPFGAAGVIGPFSPSLPLIRANLWVKSTRTGQLMTNLLRRVSTARKGPRYWGGMEMFRESRVAADDPKLRTTYSHFHDNLEAICQAGTNAGAKVVVCTVPVNLTDCAPFASVHAPGLSPETRAKWEKNYQAGIALEAAGKWAEAVARYQFAMGLDDQFADLPFRLGTCQAALGHLEDAWRWFARARDLDALRFRTDSTLNETIRRVALERASQGVILVDADADFAGAPSQDLFYEHVHMTFQGNYRLARAIFPKVAALVSAGSAAVEPPSEAECAAKLAYTGRERFKNATTIHEMMQRPPFTDQLDHAVHEARWKALRDAARAESGPESLQDAANVCRDAVKAAPDDWMLRRHYAQLLYELGAPNLAAEQCEAALERVPHSQAAQVKLGMMRLTTREFDKADAAFRAALVLAPAAPGARYGLAEVLAARGRVGEAIAAFEAQIDREPDRVEALRKLANFLVRIGRPKQARARLEEAIRDDPDDALTHADLANLLVREGDIDAAVTHFETSLRLRPDQPELVARLAELR